MNIDEIVRASLAKKIANANAEESEAEDDNEIVAVTANKTAKFGKVHLPIREGLTPDEMQYVPTVAKNEKFIDNKGLLETVALGLLHNQPVLLIGETGTGKTSCVRYICAQTNTPFRRVNLNGSTTVDDMVGKTLLDEKGTYWVDGVLLDAMKKGYVLLIDEINAGLPEVLFVLHSLLDDDRKIILVEKDGEIVRPHENFRVVATMNPAHAYVGTKMLNKALQSRFCIVEEVDFPTAAQERKILETRYPTRTIATSDMLDQMIKFANLQRAAYQKGASELIVSTRDLIHWAFLIEQLGDVNRACQLAVINKAPIEERDAIMATAKLLFGLDYETLRLAARKGQRYTKKQRVFIPAQAAPASAFPRSRFGSDATEIVLPDLVVEMKEDCDYTSSGDAKLLSSAMVGLGADGRVWEGGTENDTTPVKMGELLTILAS